MACDATRTVDYREKQSRLEFVPCCLSSRLFSHSDPRHEPNLTRAVGTCSACSPLQSEGKHVLKAASSYLLEMVSEKRVVAEERRCSAGVGTAEIFHSLSV